MDNLQLLFSHPACDVLFNDELHAVESKWKGPLAEGEELHKILNAIVDAMNQKKSNVVVADARLMHAISHDDMDWIINDWYPRALDAGFRYEALVVTDYTFNAVTVRKIVRTYDEKKVRTEYFKTVPAAYDWVRKGFPE